MSDCIVHLLVELSSKERLDRFLADNIPEHSRSHLQGLIKEGFVSVDGCVIVKASLPLEQGMRVEVRIPPPSPSNLIAENIPLDIVFENDDLLVVNKAAGMVVHPSPGHDRGTLVHAALSHLPDIEGIGGKERPGIVHRLDKETSGLILLAKNERAHRWLQDQFKSRDVQKTYVALVDGAPPTPKGRIEAPIGRDPSHRKQMAVLSPGKGREAISEYKTLEHFSTHTLLEVSPLTGRTHQIRLHLSFLGCPVVGDTTYGRKHPSLALGRHFLHAAHLKITLPKERKPRIFEAPLPEELARVLDDLRRTS